MRNDKTPARLWMREQTRAGRKAAASAIALGVVQTLAAVGQAGCLGWALGQLIERRHDHLLAALIGFASFAFVRAVASVIADRIAFRAGASARRQLRSDALSRLVAAGSRRLNAEHSGAAVATVIDRIEALDGFFVRYIPATILAMAGPALVALTVLPVDPLAAGVLLLAGLLVPVGMAVAGIGAASASRRQFQAMARLQVRFLDRVRGIATIVLSGQTEAEAQALAAAAADLRRRTMRVLRVAFLSSVALDAALAVALVVLTLRYAAQARGGTLPSVWGAVFVLLLVPEFFAPIRRFAAAYQDQFQATAAAEALTGLPTLPPPAPPVPVRTVSAHGITVAFDQVVFSWDESRGPALDGLSFRVPAGETMVLTGPSGSGKSTVLEILLGFAVPHRGRVTLNGANITSIVPHALSQMTAWIGQRPTLFNGTIRDNIRFARPNATDAEIADAAKAARVEAFACELPDGLDTRIGEGGYGLSGGQAQRVAIARAFLKNAPLLLLDEPTAHLDPTTEAEVFDSLRRLALGRTVIVASHASAAHSFAGRRLDIRAGRAVEVGARGVA